MRYAGQRRMVHQEGDGMNQDDFQKEIQRIVFQAFGLEPPTEQEELWKSNRTDCFWNDTFQDGPATHMVCRLRQKCLCQNCPGYISKEKADRIIREKQAEEYGV